MNAELKRSAGEHEYYEGARLCRKGRLLEAERVLRHGIERYREGTGHEHPWCHSLLGGILAQTKQDQKSLDEAEVHFREAAEASDFDAPGIVRNLALFLLLTRRDPAHAEAVLRRALNQRRNHETYAVLGYVLEKQDRRDEARQQYLQAIIRPPTLLGHLAEKEELWQVQTPDVKTLSLEALRSSYLQGIAARPQPEDDNSKQDWNLGYWYALAMDGFVRTSRP